MKTWRPALPIDHAEAYVNGRIHTNGCENFWSLRKRSINGTYVSVEPYHLFRYVDERMNRRSVRTNRRTDDAMMRSGLKRRLAALLVDGSM